MQCITISRISSCTLSFTEYNSTLTGPNMSTGCNPEFLLLSNNIPENGGNQFKKSIC